MFSFDSCNSTPSEWINPIATLPAHVVEISCTAIPQPGFTIITLQGSENIAVLMSDAPVSELAYR